MAEALQHFIASRYDGRNLPVTLVLPDGEPRAAVPGTHRRHRRALLARTARTGLARAGLAGPRLRPRRPRLHRQRAADAGRRGSDGRRSVSHGHDHARAQLRVLAATSRRGNRAQHHPPLRRGRRLLRALARRRRVYSCAYFRHEDDTLEAAQEQKLDHICRKLRLAPGGAPARHRLRLGVALLWAAQRYGVHAVGSRSRTTSTATPGMRARAGEPRGNPPAGLPRRAGERAVRQGLEHRDVRARRQGHMPVYCAKINRLLKPGGLVLNHGITLQHARPRGAGQRHRKVRRGLRISGRRAVARLVRDRGDGQAGPRGRWTSRTCGRITRRRSGTGSTGSRRTATRRITPRGEKVPDLAHLHGGLRPRVRSRLDVAVAGAGRQGRTRTAACHAR